MRAIVTTLGILSLVGCAVVPRYEYTYYLPEAQTVVSVVQTIDCDTQRKNLLLDVAAPTVTTAYRANLNKPRTLDTTELGGNWAEAKVAMGFYSDGRLKSVGHESEGQGEATVKAAISLFKLVGGGVASVRDDTAICTQLASIGGDKPIVLSYAGSLNDYENTPSLTLVPTYASAPLHRLVVAALAPLALSPLVLHVEPPVVLAHPTSAGLDAKNSVELSLNKTGVVVLELKHDTTSVWAGRVLVPLNDAYAVGIPEARAFGKNSFALALGEAGDIESISFSQAPGGVGAMGATGAVLEATASPTAAQTAAALEAEANVIVQSRRLAACRNDPSTCE